MACLIKGGCQIIHNKIWQFNLSENLGLNRCENVPVTAKYLLMLMGALKLKLGRKTRPSLLFSPPVSILLLTSLQNSARSLLFGFFAYMVLNHETVRIYLPLRSSLLSSNLMFVSADLVDGQCYEVIQAIFMRQDMLFWDYRCYKTKPHQFTVDYFLD